MFANKFTHKMTKFTMAITNSKKIVIRIAHIIFLYYFGILINFSDFIAILTCSCC